VLDHVVEYFNEMSRIVCRVHTRIFAVHLSIKKTFLDFIKMW
jgi:hypothetical protein